jgi:hypothetical protein
MTEQQAIDSDGPETIMSACVAVAVSMVGVS